MRYGELGDYSEDEVAHLIELGIPLSALEREAIMGIKRRVSDGSIIIVHGRENYYIGLEFQKGFNFKIGYGDNERVVKRKNSIDDMIEELKKCRIVRVIDNEQ